MSTQTFKIPRWNDGQVIRIMNEIVAEFSLKGAKVYWYPFQGGTAKEVELSQWEKDSDLKALVDLQESGIHYFHLNVNGKQIFNIRREGKNLFDDLNYDWDNARAGVDEKVFARLIISLKKRYKEIKIDEAFSGFPNGEINKYLEARDATLTRLETVNQELLYGTHKRQKELDENYQRKIQELDIKFIEQQKILQKEFEVKEQKLVDKEEAFKKKEAEFETHESKYIRRQLRQDLLKKLQALSEKFELTKGAQRKRYPVMGFAVAFSGFFAYLTITSFSQTVALIEAVGKDLSLLNWWVIGLLSLKQLVYASAFVGGIWYLIKWNDRWFRQHADAEFNFKQLELDINRASWVVEMALEWKDEKGKELPSELLDRLTKNLFKDVSQSNADTESPPDIPSLLLGPASSVKFKAGNGTEIEYDRKGIKKALED